jgi:DNA polymerase III delta prime subunit
MSKIPWVEFYRPKEFNNIVLDDVNKEILNNIIDKSYFPNLLLYGPPGTGKTTTIVNLINAYQQKLGNKNKDLITHLNASDERGIDIIRNQISVFVNSKPLFHTGMKFVILDEVDYMTKNAQQALRYLLQNYSKNVRFCLICNYISKIDEGLQNEFIKLRFNQLPKNDIVKFLKHISESEKLNLTDESLLSIQQLYKSDIRSMINFMQSNQDILKIDYTNEIKLHIVDNNVWETFIAKLSKKENVNELHDYIYSISKIYNMDKKNIIKNFLDYIIRNKIDKVTPEFLGFVENLLHSQSINNNTYIFYALLQLSRFTLA